MARSESEYPKRKLTGDATGRMTRIVVAMRKTTLRETRVQYPLPRNILVTKDIS